MGVRDDYGSSGNVAQQAETSIPLLKRPLVYVMVVDGQPNTDKQHVLARDLLINPRGKTVRVKLVSRIRVVVLRQAEVAQSVKVWIRIDQVLNCLGHRTNALGGNLVIRKGIPCERIDNRDLPEKS